MNLYLRRCISPMLHSSHRHSDGFSLLEVMIALMILSIGLLGVAGVQLLSLQQTGNAQLRSQATLYAQDVVSRIRVNDDQALSTTEMDRIRRNMRETMGPDANITVTTSSNDMVILVSWKERDPFAEGGTSSETFSLRARSKR